MLDHAVLAKRIRPIHSHFHETSGRPRVKAELAEQGMAIDGKRIAWLMSAVGLLGVSRGLGFGVIARRDNQRRPVPELVQRKFTAHSPNDLWVTDMACVPSWAGFSQPPAVLDVWDRRMAGWSVGERVMDGVR